MANSYHYGLGRRKSSTARARVTSGKGKITINDLPAEDYLDKSERLQWELQRPFEILELSGKYDVSLRVTGGGISGQVDACTLAISKAMAEMNDDLRGTLKKAGLLKRDPREKERKKPGLKGARKKEQFSKR
ncbi:TPA: 30S ribosomal protein S9 [Candidatus Saccharibacteria bacterium]|nr:30S ribosomal protein S9 [Candidatus Saccharibacteria bacterium]HIO87371.1 30S ribosomal protein S9 [Candidatus Saccharibacteria bacterium]